MLDLARNANLGLAFFLELGMLAALATGAFALDLNAALKWLVAIVVVGAAITAWAIWAAPTSPTRLAGLGLEAFKIVLFVLAALALLAARQYGWAIAFAALSTLNFALAWAWDQQ